MLVGGKVESWVVIMDASNLSLFKLPISVINISIKLLSSSKKWYLYSLSISHAGQKNLYSLILLELFKFLGILQRVFLNKKPDPKYLLSLLRKSLRFKKSLLRICWNRSMEEISRIFKLIGISILIFLRPPINI